MVGCNDGGFERQEIMKHFQPKMKLAKAFLSSLALAQIQIGNLSLPLANTMTLFSSPQILYTFSYEISQPNTLTGQLELTSTGLLFDHSWMGIGFGYGMLDAQFIVCRKLYILSNLVR